MKPGFEFRTIGLPRDRDICVSFWREAYACSFDEPDKHRTLTDDEYVEWLAARIIASPTCCVEMMNGTGIIGQLVMNPKVGTPAGYVSLFYLVPEMRGSGAGDALHDYLVAVSAGMGVQKLRLNVSPTNGRALGYYRKHGWVDLGAQPGHEEVHLMELTV